MPANDQSAGATPAVDGATPSQTPAEPAAATSTATTTPATGDSDADGMTTDAGRAALRREREAREKAERELAKLQRQTQTDSERAIADAKAAGVTEATERFAGAIRRSSVRAALTAAGLAGNLADLAAKADEFASLKVTDDGEVEGLNQAIEAFKRAQPDLFKATTARAAGDSGLGPRGTPAAGGRVINTLIRQAAGRA